MFNRNFFASTLLAIVATLFALVATPASAQTTETATSEADTMVAPMRQTPARVAEVAVPFTCPPIIEFAACRGNIGGDVERQLGLFRFNAFTSDSLESDFVRVMQFETLVFDTAYGRTIIGREGKVSWVDLKVERPGWIVLKYWFQGVTIQTGFENHLSGGAIEGQIVLHTNQFGGWCIHETWSTPEGFALSSRGRRINYGSLDGKASLMFDKLCLWRVPTWDNDNHLAFNQLTVTPNVLTWQPFELSQPGTDLRFNLGWLKITFPCQ